MPQSTETNQSVACHWDYIEGPRRLGHSTRSLVWICEYPYRTIRQGPSDDCDSCRRALAHPGEDRGSEARA